MTFLADCRRTIYRAEVKTRGNVFWSIVLFSFLDVSIVIYAMFLVCTIFLIVQLVGLGRVVNCTA